MWRVLKLMKWKGVDDSEIGSSTGDLVLFCLACPQPRVNLDATDVDLSQYVMCLSSTWMGRFIFPCSWKFLRSIMMDGNFKVEHMRLRNPADEVWLMDGKGFMVGSANYKEYLAGTANRIEVRECTTGSSISHPLKSDRSVAITGQLIRQIRQGNSCHPLGLGDVHVQDMDVSSPMQWLTFRRENSRFS